MLFEPESSFIKIKKLSFNRELTGRIKHPSFVHD